MTRAAFDFGPGAQPIPLASCPLAVVLARVSGPILCRVIGAAVVTEWGPHVRAPATLGGLVLAVEYTARGARSVYRVGRPQAAWPIGDVVPRAAFRPGPGPFAYRVGPYRWADTLPELTPYLSKGVAA